MNTAWKSSMTEIPEDIDPQEDFVEFVKWVDEELQVIQDDGYDIHLGNCPECGMNEYYIHFYFEEETEAMTNCIWCGHTAKAL